jgi:hypothetical protein
VGVNLQFVPNALKTPDLCLAAVQNDGKALAFVPEALKTPELSLVAAQEDGEELEQESSEPSQANQETELSEKQKKAIGELMAMCLTSDMSLRVFREKLKEITQSG